MQRVQITALRHAFNGAERFAFGFHRQHQAGANQPAIHRNGTGAAITRAAAFLGTGQAKRAAQRIQHAVMRFTQELHRFPVNGGRNMHFGHQISSGWRVRRR